MRSRLSDLGVASIPFVLGLFGPGAHGGSWSLPLSAAIGVALYWRRRFPLRALAACFAIGLVQLTAAVAGGPSGHALPGFYDAGVIIAIYSAVDYGARATRVIAVTGGIGGAAVAAAVWASEVRDTANEILAVSVLFAPVLLAWAFGTAARNRRAFLAGLEDRAERLQRGREALARVAVAEERERIARELHDIIALNGHPFRVDGIFSDGILDETAVISWRDYAAAFGPGRTPTS